MLDHDDADPNQLVLAMSRTIREMAILLRRKSRTKVRRSFLSFLDDHCVLVSQHLTRIISTPSTGKGSVLKILDHFALLINASWATEDRERSTHSRQRALNLGWEQVRDKSQTDKLKFAGKAMDMAHLANRRFIRKFNEDVRLLKEALESENSDDSSLRIDKPQPSVRPEPSYQMLGATQSIYQALAGSSKCDCHGIQELHARLWLGTYQKLNPDDNDDLDMFLSLRQVLQEAHVHAVRDVKTRLALNDEMLSIPTKLDYKPMLVTSLCKEINKMQSMTSQRMELQVERGQLFKLRSRDSCFQVDRRKQPMTLQVLINEYPRLLKDRPKRILAVLLTYAVLHLHGTPWLPPRWDASKILFLQTSSLKTPLRPFIQSHIAQKTVSLDSSDGSNADPDDSKHPFPTLVSLAIVLMELYFATAFDVLAGISTAYHSQSTEVSRGMHHVSSVFRRYQDEVAEPFYSAIQKCLEPEVWTTKSKNPVDDGTLRDILYREITKPFEDFLCDGFGHNGITIEELDEVAGREDIGCRKTTIPALAPALTYEGARLCHNDNGTPSGAHSSHVSSRYQEWRTDYQEVYTAFIDDHTKSEPPPRVKIAVLDSGVDVSHHMIKDYIDEKCNYTNWTNKSKKLDDVVDDLDGHGTFVAGLIMDYAPDANLYIAKVHDRIEGVPPPRAAKAIKDAVRWGADIISMSLGYETNDGEGYVEPEDAIEQARRARVLLFAAASNEGGNKNRLYPARQSDVIAVHATDVYGNRSEFSPTALTHHLNFATVGEDVESCFPTSQRGPQTKEWLIRKSGTSFATPILAGIAGFLLSYARLHLEDEAPRLKKKETMENLLFRISQKTQHSTDRDGYNYVQLSLCRDNLFGKAKREVEDIIRGVLKG